MHQKEKIHVKFKENAQIIFFTYKPATKGVAIDETMSKKEAS